MSDKVLRRDESVYLGNKHKFPRKKKILELQNLLQRCIKVKAEIHKYICICYCILMSINYMGFSARSGE